MKRFIGSAGDRFRIFRSSLRLDYRSVKWKCCRQETVVVKPWSVGGGSKLYWEKSRRGLLLFAFIYECSMKKSLLQNITWRRAYSSLAGQEILICYEIRKLIILVTKSCSCSLNLTHLNWIYMLVNCLGRVIKETYGLSAIQEIPCLVWNRDLLSRVEKPASYIQSTQSHIFVYD